MEHGLDGLDGSTRMSHLVALPRDLVRLVNGILMLTDSRPDRRVSAGVNTGQQTGSATIYIMIAPGVWQTFRINSTNPAASCSCLM
jgi:hypothetical protein